MRRRSTFHALILASAALTPFAAYAAQPSDPATGVAALLSQASFWRSQGNTAQSEQALRRLLAVDPRNLDALSTLGQEQAERGDAASAQDSLKQLRAAAPGDARLPALGSLIRSGPADPQALAEAGQLQRHGRAAEAVARYRRLFSGDEPPASFATEYYQALAMTPAGWDTAREQLSRQVSANPEDLRGQLAYAQTLTLRDATRPDGIARLQRLAQKPAIEAEAASAYRQALLWPLQAPAAAPAQPDPPARASLQAAIERNPNDEAALIGLAGLLAHGGRPDDADALFERASRLIEPRDAGAASAQAITAAAAPFNDPVIQAGLFRAAIQSSPNNAWFRLGFARALLSQGRGVEAKAVAATGSPAPDFRRVAEIFAAEAAMPPGTGVPLGTGRQLASLPATRVHLSTTGDAGLASASIPPLRQTAYQFTHAVAEATPTTKPVAEPVMVANSGEILVARAKSGGVPMPLAPAHEPASVALLPRPSVRYAQYVPADIATDVPLELPPSFQPFVRAGGNRPMPSYGDVAPLRAKPLAMPDTTDLPRPTIAAPAGDTIPPAPVTNPFRPLPPVPTPTRLIESPVTTQDLPFGPPGANPFRPAAGPAPVQVAQNVAQNQAIDVPPFYNPFRGTAPTLQSTSPNIPPLAAPDPLTQDIDRSIAQLSETVAPQIYGAVSLRGRSGSDGASRLTDLETPLEASFSPNGYGRLKVAVTPVVLLANRVKEGGFDQQNFGTNALVPLDSAGLVQAPRPKDQHAAGSAVDVSYGFQSVTADVGSTPVGFLQKNVVGGVQYTPSLTQELRVRALVERRAVTDSLLSYGGSKDPRTGLEFGGVTRTRAYVGLEGQAGQVSFYGGGGGGLYHGQNVANNTEYEAGTGVSVPIFKTETQEVDLGLNLIYFGFKRNLGQFSLGQGGYFSPSHFLAALVPLTYKAHPTPDLSYSIGGTVGVQNFSSAASDVFPNDPARQASAVAIAASNPGSIARYPKTSQTGIAGGASGEIDYRLTPNWHVGATAGFQRTGNFTEGTGLVYARYTFNQVE